MGSDSSLGLAAFLTYWKAALVRLQIHTVLPCPCAAGCCRLCSLPHTEGWFTREKVCMRNVES